MSVMQAQTEPWLWSSGWVISSPARFRPTCDNKVGRNMRPRGAFHTELCPPAALGACGHYQPLLTSPHASLQTPVTLSMSQFACESWVLWVFLLCLSHPALCRAAKPGCNVVERKEESWQEQCGADLVLPKATCYSGQLRTRYDDAEDNLSRITSLHKAIQILGMRNTAVFSVHNKNSWNGEDSVSKINVRSLFF